jgi:hypothetical protein
VGDSSSGASADSYPGSITLARMAEAEAVGISLTLGETATVETPAGRPSDITTPFGMVVDLLTLFGLEEPIVGFALLFGKGAAAEALARGAAAASLPDFLTIVFSLPVIPNFAGGNLVFENFPHVLLGDNIVIIYLRGIPRGLGERQHSCNPPPPGCIQG